MEVLPFPELPGLIYFLGAVILYYISVLLYALRWKVVLRAVGRDIPISNLVKAVLSSIFVNNITPTSRGGGELLRIAWITKKNRVPLAVSAASVLYERVVEAFPLAILLALGMLYLINVPLLPLLIIALLILVWTKWEKVIELLAKMRKLKIEPGEIDSLRNLKKKASLNILVFLLSSTVWLFDVLRLKLITMAVGLDLELWVLLPVSLVNFLLGIVAFTPGGLGIVEGGLIGTLMLFGIPHTMAVAVTILERAVSFLLSSLTGFLTLLYMGGSELWRALKSQ